MIIEAKLKADKDNRKIEYITLNSEEWDLLRLERETIELLPRASKYYYFPLKIFKTRVFGVSIWLEEARAHYDRFPPPPGCHL